MAENPCAVSHHNAKLAATLFTCIYLFAGFLTAPILMDEPRMFKIGSLLYWVCAAFVIALWW